MVPAHDDAAANSARAHAAHAQPLASGFDRAFAVAAGIAVLTLLVTIAAIRVRRAGLSGPHQVTGSAMSE